MSTLYTGHIQARKGGFIIIPSMKRRHQQQFRLIKKFISLPYATKEHAQTDLNQLLKCLRCGDKFVPSNPSIQMPGIDMILLAATATMNETPTETTTTAQDGIVGQDHDADMAGQARQSGGVDEHAGHVAEAEPNIGNASVEAPAIQVQQQQEQEQEQEQEEHEHAGDIQDGDDDMSCNEDGGEGGRFDDDCDEDGGDYQDILEQIKMLQQKAKRLKKKKQRGAGSISGSSSSTERPKRLRAIVDSTLKPNENDFILPLIGDNWWEDSRLKYDSPDEDEFPETMWNEFVPIQNVSLDQIHRVVPLPKKPDHNEAIHCILPEMLFCEEKRQVFINFNNI